MRRQLSDINEREATRMEDMEREAEYFKNILKQYWDCIVLFIIIKVTYNHCTHYTTATKVAEETYLASLIQTTTTTTTI